MTSRKTCFFGANIFRKHHFALAKYRKHTDGTASLLDQVDKEDYPSESVRDDIQARAGLK